jgi:hypothetical protein
MGDSYTDRDDIISAPTGRPTNLALKRNGETMELTFAIPLYLRSSDYYGKTITFIDAAWSFNASTNMDTRWKEVREGYGHTIADRLWIRDLGTSASSHSQDFERDRYSPVTPGRYLNSVDAWVMINDFADAGTDAASFALFSKANTKVRYNFRPPLAGVWGEPEFDASDNEVTCSFECNEDLWTPDGADRERYDTHWQVFRKDNINDEFKSESVIAENAVTDDSFTVSSGAIAGANSLAYNQWIDIHFRARCRGIAGESYETHVMYTIAQPPKATVQETTVDKGKGTVTVRIKTNTNAYHPCDTVELYRLADTTIWTVAAAKQVPTSSWTLAASSADSQCSGLVDQLSEAQPSRDHYTFYRVKTTRCGYEQWSEPFRAKELEKLGSPVDDDIVQIYSVTPQVDGTSLKVVMGWNYYGSDGHRDDSNGTEVSWSKYEDAWHSTTPPSIYDLDDSLRDSSSQVPGKTSSAFLVIRDLEEGIPYYIKARRYQDNVDNRIYALNYATAPAASYPISPTIEEVGVHLTGPQYVKRGDGLTLTWTIDSDKEQVKWNLYRQWEEDGPTPQIRRQLVHRGNDQSGTAVLPAWRMRYLDSATFVVSVLIGSTWSESDPFTVIVADPPTLDVLANVYFGSQPIAFQCISNSTNVDIISKIVACGTSSGTPDGELVQVEGDVLWSEKIRPTSWTPFDTRFMTSYTIPTKLPFVDGARYILACTVVDRTTGLSSKTVSEQFAIDWDHKASPPDPDSTITTDIANRSVRVHPIAPSGAANTDVYDLYRVTNDSVDLIAEGQLFGIDAIDRYAPYSRTMGLMYRIATRTAEGDIQWADFVYDMPVGVMCFDWSNGRHLELPYNIALQDSYEKNYESHQHMDGSVSGHWNPGFNKTGTYSTDIIKIRDADQVRRVREMATYPGPVFVRTPDGGAFEANVTLGVDTTYSSGAVGVSLNVNAHTMSDAFMLGADDFDDTSETGE